MELSELVPPYVIHTLRDRLVVGVADAEAHYQNSSADEDSLTGALGHSISRHPPEFVSIGSERYAVSIYYRKVRARGPGAPEHSTGADGIFQIDVRNAQNEIAWKKGLSFQAKKEWSGTDSRLAGQAQDMIDGPGDGLVIDYSPDGYKACDLSPSFHPPMSRVLSCVH
jgi:hypothetical protein